MLPLCSVVHITEQEATLPPLLLHVFREEIRKDRMASLVMTLDKKATMDLHRFRSGQVHDAGEAWEVERLSHGANASPRRRHVYRALVEVPVRGPACHPSEAILPVALHGHYAADPVREARG